MTDLDTPLVEKVLDVAERERVADVHHHRQADDLWARLDVAKGGTFDHRGRVGRSRCRLNPSSPDKILGSNGPHWFG